MNPLIRSCRTLSLILIFMTTKGGAAKEVPVIAGPKPKDCWQVKDVRRGMKGYGVTVMKGTKLERFQAEVLGVLHGTSPGRDMVLCRLSGLGLERSGIIAGMSGSPVYIENKLLGAVAYGWAYGKDPIAGITPFCQMHSFVEAFEKRDLAQKKKNTRIGRHRLRKPVRIGDKLFESVAVSQSFAEDESTNKDELWLRPLRTPLAASGFSANSLSLLKKVSRGMGLVPMQGGSAGGHIHESEKETALVPGGPLTIAMIRGDFDLSGIGTVTHIEGERVYGWGHPFMSLGGCEFPLMTGYIHTIYPRQSVSFKMGSPLRTVGVINADVSTGIAGWLHRKPDMLPVKMKVRCDHNSRTQTFNVEVARQPSLLASLVYTALTNSIDMEGQLPDEMTARFRAVIELEHFKTIEINDTYSGFSGGRAPSALYSQVASMVSLLTRNEFKQVRIKRIECDTKIFDGRQSADIESIELESKEVEPGETLKATVLVRPYKGELEKIKITLKLPVDLPEGTYKATVANESSLLRRMLRDNPSLYYPKDLNKLVESVHIQTKGKRTKLAMRVPVGTSGVSVQGKDHPNLPGSVVQIMSNTRRNGSRKLQKSLLAQQKTDHVISGELSVSFRVTNNTKANLR